MRTWPWEPSYRFSLSASSRDWLDRNPRYKLTSWRWMCHFSGTSSTKLNHKNNDCFQKYGVPQRHKQEIIMHQLCGVSYDWQVCLVSLVALKWHKSGVSYLELLWYLYAYVICRIVYHSEPSSHMWCPVYSLLYWQPHQVQHLLLSLRNSYLRLTRERHLRRSLMIWCLSSL